MYQQKKKVDYVSHAIPGPDVRIVTKLRADSYIFFTPGEPHAERFRSTFLRLRILNIEIKESEQLNLGRI